MKIGDSNRITREYFDSLLLEMRHIDAVIPDTSIELYGERFSTPVMTAALSHLNNCHPDGMVELARGAKAANALMWAGMGDEEELEGITGTGAKTIKIIKPYIDNDVIFRKIKHAEECGCIAVGIDTDHAYNWRGENDIILGLEMTGKSLDEIKQFVKSTKLPFIIKGVLSTVDAIKCIDAGVQGIVVSHHHGIMDFAVPPLMILPEIVDVVKNKMKIFVDCGVENGFDVFKAIALGADAVSVGRALMGPLSENGADAVKAKIEDITTTLAGTMARTTCSDLSKIDKSIVKASWRVYT
ncbi:MAG: alpha-hydroxy-acid oxidizing protein [Oscillospiraceae bacterium]|jgi:isopentenyl diphosphate isomerase/L-lactate dehydrogenase-like FMN-dependent dehydrogenase|nr:alpha-hydroxy-acid oxidizing protein [Oscillospiraceae bacterium]